MPELKRTVTGVLGGLLGLVGLSAVAGLLVTATVTPAIAVTGAAAKQAIDVFEDLPAYLEVNPPMEPWNIWVTNAEGKHTRMATFYEQNRIPLTYDQLSPTVVDAILSSEDKTFFDHSGINLGATVKAVVDNLRGTSSRGASTITQQLVKNVQVQECETNLIPGEEDYDQKMKDCWSNATESKGTEGIQRKLQEMRYALQIEKQYSKNEILLGYLNIANFGGQTYGIEAAANYYFGVSSKNLTIAQAATLAGMVQEPNSLRIDRPTAGTSTTKDGVARNTAEDGYALTKDRRDYVIRRMFADGKITADQRDEALESEIVPDITNRASGCAVAGANAYFCQYVKTVVESDPAFGETAEDRKMTLRKGGFDVYTTLDPVVQKAGVDVMKNSVPSHLDRIEFGATSVTLEASTGRILAMVQNTKFSEREADRNEPGYSAQVYAADAAHGSSTGFSVGSAFKLFTLLNWLEHGRSVNEVINGTSRLFPQFQCHDRVLTNSTVIGNAGGGRGSVSSIYRFTAASTNTGYLAMAAQTDLCEISEMAERLGVKFATGGKLTDEPPNPYDVLGWQNIAPLDMAAAYATVANEGVYCTPTAIDRVVDREGNEIEPPESSCTRVLSPEVAATAAYTLRGVMSATGSRSNTGDGVQLFGKTGTHQGIQTMMIVSSTEATTATWAGNVQGKVRLSTRSYKGVALSNMRHTITRAIQRAANSVYGGERFPSPDRELTKVVYTDLPSVVGMTVKEATDVLEDAGFTVRVGEPVDSDLPTNIIAAQDPGAGKVAGGIMVTISLSNGEGLSVPDLSGQTPGDAIGALYGHGFSTVELGSCSVDPEMHPSEPGSVTSTSPAAGTVVHKDARVRVNYSAPSC